MSSIAHVCVAHVEGQSIRNLDLGNIITKIPKGIELTGSISGFGADKFENHRIAPAQDCHVSLILKGGQQTPLYQRPPEDFYRER